MSATVPTRADAVALDAADPLAPLAARVVDRDPGGTIYVDGNSLGRLPAATPAALTALTDDWSTRLVGAWEDWITWPTALGDRLGAAALGAGPGQTLVCDSVTVNLFKLARAALDGREGRVVAWADEFPTDRYVVDGLGREVVWLDGEPDAAAVAAVGDAALVVCSLVHYRSGALADLPAVTAAAHAIGALILWDLSHAVGSVAIDLPGSGADLAVGCTYKYLCGGPGAPAFLWVREDLIDGLVSPIPGWFGQADQFAMGPRYVPRAGIERFLAGTPPIVALAAVGPGVDLVAAAGIDAIQAKGRALTGLAITLADAWLQEHGFTVGTPRDPSRRGGHVALHHPDAWRVCRALIEHAQVVPDFRRPDVVRLGFPAVATSFADVWDACDRLRTLMAAGAHERVDAAARRVT